MTWVAIGTSAAIGAGTAAVTGGDSDDILKGAILGGITGGVTSGITPTGTEGLTSGTPELLNVAPEVATTAAPEGILQAQPLQYANAPTVASDVGQYGQDRQILDMMQNYNNAQPTLLNDPTISSVPTTVSAPVEAGPYQFPSAEGIPTAAGPQTYADLPGHMESYSEPQSGLGKGFNSALEWMDKNPFKTGLLGYTALNALGAFNPEDTEMPDRRYKGSLSGYRMSPNFQPSRATPNVYTPRYAAQGGIMMAAGGSYTDEPMGDDQGYAAGGIASYRRGRTVDAQGELNEYMKMMEGEAPRQAPAPDYVGTTGIIRDQDPDTKYQDALTASMIRMGKVGSKANYEPYKNMKRPNAMGGINLSAPGIKPAENKADRDDYAAGGITQADRYNMGGYASGSVPRLLKGPGDGMSDNIPATIDGRQPARLADGEFVIPADVVSHLGNGSTEAGAKHLHKMMTDVRKDRTGNPKQGKQIQAEKYIPKKKKRA
jgi:hypothetical protein